jgi:C4-dicarboxylate-binding protein DctP
VLEQAMRETTTFANQIAQKENDDAMAAIRASALTEVHDLTAAERAEWRKVLQPGQDDMEKPGRQGSGHGDPQGNGC